MDGYSIRVEREGAVTVLRVAGEVEDAGASALRGDIARVIDEPGNELVIDLTEVTFLPSVAVGILVRALKEAEDKGCPLEFRAAGGTIAQRVLLVCALPHRTS